MIDSWPKKKTFFRLAKYYAEGNVVKEVERQVMKKM